MKVIPHGREFAGFSLEQIEEVTRGREEKRKEQGRALRMEKKLQVNIFLLSIKIEQSAPMQVLRSREARAKWREEARRMIKEREARREEESSPPPPGTPPFASDPDWSLAMCGLGEAVERQRLKRGDDEVVAKAVKVVEEELDREVEKVVEWAGRPGEEEEEVRSRRSEKIARLNNKMARMRRAISAPRL